MTGALKNQVERIMDYHERTKHRQERYAASPRYMDWANQPDPFRTYQGVEKINLLHPDHRLAPSYDGLFFASPPARFLDDDLVSRLFYQSMALSAWKQAPKTSPWSLRINPSSGALHPTEAYLITGPVPGLIREPGVFHYAPFRHQLERRCQMTQTQWELLVKSFPQPCLLLGLTSIYWRESWKYGERAFRYCNLDVGHAVGALIFSARMLGWETVMLNTISDARLERLLGTYLQEGAEKENPDCLMVMFPSGKSTGHKRITQPSSEAWSVKIPDVEFTGKPNTLSHKHRDWPAIEAAALAAKNNREFPLAITKTLTSDNGMTAQLLPDRNYPAEKIIRQRRSAVEMDARSSIPVTVLYHLLMRTLPHSFPSQALFRKTRIALMVFVHRVEGLDPGLYLLVREPSHEELLRQALKPEFLWHKPETCPDDLGFYCLLPGDFQFTAQTISCHQSIAGRGVLSMGMLAEFNNCLKEEGPQGYPRLFWEAGLIGQVLYLEAEAAGLRGTGIGCFFDDDMHALSGIKDHSWQSLYHFTMGGPLEDERLRTLPPYAHLG